MSIQEPSNRYSVITGKKSQGDFTPSGKRVQMAPLLLL